MSDKNSAATGVILFFAAFTAVVLGQNRSADWPQWRGPNRDGAVASFTAPKSWPDHLTLKWKVPVGLGYATPILVGNTVYMYTRRDEKEFLAALDAATGKTTWETSYAAPHFGEPGRRAPRPWTEVDADLRQR